MRARDVVGKTIKAVHQSLHVTSGGERAYAIDAIELTDGSRISFFAMLLQSGDVPEVEARYRKPKQFIQQDAKP